MKAVRLTELGGPEKLHIEDVPKPEPGPGQILVRIKRAAFNRRDVFITQNLYPGISLPRTLGSDGCGEIAELGEGVTGHAVGAPVVINPEFGWSGDGRLPEKSGDILGMPADGTFAEYVVVPATAVYAKPAPLSDDEAAAIPLAGLTAYRATFTRGKIVKDDVVLIPGVGSGVQTFVLVYAKHVGARTIVTSGSDAKLERAKAFGADVTINYKSDPDWHKTARKAAGGAGPTLVVDSTGGDTLSKSIDIVAPGGRVVIYGGTQGDAKIRPFSIFWKHVDVLGSSMGSPSDFSAMLELF
ncbi:MAG: zinc-binding dehydrogenase, partial [Candidatus Eremiobacteraeota bacterium]|nr:zinc-binding dehydrogenase [Candidatus Eremiobacteraeota bacterium]